MVVVAAVDTTACGPCLALVLFVRWSCLIVLWRPYHTPKSTDQMDLELKWTKLCDLRCIPNRTELKPRCGCALSRMWSCRVPPRRPNRIRSCWTRLFFWFFCSYACGMWQNTSLVQPAALQTSFSFFFQTHDLTFGTNPKYTVWCKGPVKVLVASGTTLQEGVKNQRKPPKKRFKKTKNNIRSASLASRHSCTSKISPIWFKIIKIYRFFGNFLNEMDRKKLIGKYRISH